MQFLFGSGNKDLAHIINSLSKKVCVALTYLL